MHATVCSVLWRSLLCPYWLVNSCYTQRPVVKLSWQLVLYVRCLTASDGAPDTLAGASSRVTIARATLPVYQPQCQLVLLVITFRRPRHQSQKLGEAAGQINAPLSSHWAAACQLNVPLLTLDISYTNRQWLLTKARSHLLLSWGETIHRW